MIFFLAISTCILTAGWGRVVMKKALESKPPLVCALIFEIVQTLVALPLFFLYEPPKSIHLSIISGTIFAVSLVLYFMSFHNSEVSLLTPLRGLRGVFALIISLLWWHEAITLTEGLGVIIIGLGILFLHKASRFEKLLHFLFHREAILMMLSVVGGVLSSYTDKLGTAAMGIYTYYLFTCASASVALLIACLIQYGGRKTWNYLTSDISSHNITVGLIFTISFVTQLIALQYGRVTIVNGLLPLGVLVTAFLANRYLKENIVEKLPGTILVVVGTILIAVL
jgi:uncharacterized membrane protein